MTAGKNKDLDPEGGSIGPQAESSQSDSDDPPRGGPAKSLWDNKPLLALLGVFVGSLVTMANSLLTLNVVEKPRLELELRKSSIEMHKQLLELAPSIEVVCRSKKLSSWSWKVSCTAGNKGRYHADVELYEVGISVDSDSEEKFFPSGSGFSVDFPDEKRRFRSPPGSDGDLWFYIQFDQEKYPKGINGDHLLVRVRFRFTTIESARSYFLKYFPDLKGLAGDIAQNGLAMHVSLASS